MKVLRSGVALVLLLCFLLVIALTVADGAILENRSFFAAQYERNHVMETVGISKEDLMAITDHLLDYMKGKSDQLQLDVTIDGEERPFFSQRELDHMVDVRQMVLDAIFFRRVAVAALVLFLLFEQNRRAFCRVVVKALPVILVCMGIGAFFIGTYFTEAWWYFHVLLFSNDLWVLNPEVDLLVNLVPEAFFSACAARVGVGCAVGIGLLWGFCFWRYKKDKRV